MEMKLNDSEVKGALDYWLRQTHPTLMEGKEIVTMTLAQYPGGVTMSIEAPKAATEQETN